MSRSVGLIVLVGFAILFISAALWGASDIRFWHAEIAAGSSPLVIDQSSFWMTGMAAITLLPFLGATSNITIHRGIFIAMICWGLVVPVATSLSFMAKAERKGYVIPYRVLGPFAGEREIFISGSGRQGTAHRSETLEALGPDGHPLIFDVVERRDVRALQDLIAENVDLEAHGFAQGTPLLIAAMGESWQIVDLLLQAGANPLAADEMGFTMPWVAATSRIRPETEGGRALARVRQILKERGMSDVVFPPRKVKELLSQGHWPTAQ